MKPRGAPYHTLLRKTTHRQTSNHTPRLDPFESAHIFRDAEPVPSKGTLQFLSASASRDSQGRYVKRVEPKEIPMTTIALRWTLGLHSRSCQNRSFLTELGGSLDTAEVKRRRWRGCPTRANDSMFPQRVWIIHDQREALCSLRFPGPGQR